MLCNLISVSFVVLGKLKKMLRYKLLIHAKYKRFHSKRNYQKTSKLRKQCNNLSCADFARFITYTETSIKDNIKQFWKCSFRQDTN